MPAPKGNNFAKGNKGGNPGMGKINRTLDFVKTYQQEWWDEWSSLMNGNDKNDKKYAMTEFNKLQVKTMPQTLPEDEQGNTVAPVLVTFLNKE